MLTGLAIAALALSVVALIVAVGAATRVVELERDVRAQPRSSPAGLAVGSPVPHLVLKDLDQTPIGWTAMRRGPTVAIFVSPDCGPCVKLMEALPRFRDLHPQWEIVLLARGERSRLRTTYGALPAIVAVDDGSASDAFVSMGTPHAFALRDDVIAARGHPNTLEDLEQLVTRAEVDVPIATSEPTPSR